MFIVSVSYVSLISVSCSVSKLFTSIVSLAIFIVLLLFCLLISLVFDLSVKVLSASFIGVLLLCSVTSFVIVSTVLVSDVLVVSFDTSVA